MLKELKLDNVEIHKRPAPVSKPLCHKDLKGKERVKSWNYRLVIEILTCLQGISRPNISMAVHQCAYFSASSALGYERVVTRIGRCLLEKKERGRICKIDKLKSLEYFVNTNFAGGCNQQDPLNPDNALSQTGFVIACVGILILWKIKLQTEIVLSACEAECIALSTVMRKVMLMIGL